MNFGKDRRRKYSVCDALASNMAEPDFHQCDSSRKRRTFQGKHNSRERDCFAPAEIEEWVLPEYRSLFHHIFLKEEDDTEGQSSSSTRDSSNVITSSKAIASSLHARRRKISPSGSSATSATTDDDGSLCNLVKSLPSWLKKVLHISDNEHQQNPEEIDRHAWLDEIPIEICDKLRHIHIYV